MATSSGDDPKSQPYSPRAAFDRAVVQTRNLLVDKILWWRISSDGIEGRIDAQRLEQVQPKEKARNEYQRILKREIVWALNSILLKVSVDHAIRANFGEQLLPDQVEEIQSRLEGVRTELVTKSLEERIIIRRTSKGPAIEDLRWDISTKRHDRTEGPINEIPFATVEIQYSKESTILPGVAAGFSMRKFLGIGPESLYFDCHLDDLNAIIDDLTTLRDNLDKLSRRGNS